MKLLKRCISILLIIICDFDTCPQGVLINNKTEFKESSLIVDKNIREKITI